VAVAVIIASLVCLARSSPAPRPAAPPPLPAGWTSTTVWITVGGVGRSYLVIRPQAHGAGRLPVVMELHGCCVSPQQEAQRGGFFDVTGPAILVYPAGLDQSWNAGFCCHGAQANDVDDVAFLTAVVGRVLATQSDAGQVYLAGYSNGGKMALRMACVAPHLFAAIAVYGAVNAMPCSNPVPVSLLVAASTGDPELTIGPGGQPLTFNGYTEPTVQAQVDQYLQADGCPTTAHTGTQGNLTSTTWTGCRSGNTVQLSLYQGGSHLWPQADGATPSGAQVMWTFFRTLHSPSPEATR
jgi:polyhydroxybutyrate depolymerase